MGLEYFKGLARLSEIAHGDTQDSEVFRAWDGEDYRREADVLEVSERIIRHVVTSVLRTAHCRAGLDDVESSNPINEKEFVEDGLSIALGEDTGCLDPGDLSDEDCEVLFVAKELRELLKRASEQKGNKQ